MNNNILIDKYILKSNILPFLIDLNNQKETLSFKKVCKIWNQLLNDPGTFPSPIILNLNSFFIKNINLLTTEEARILISLREGTSSIQDKKLVKATFEMLPTDRILIRRAYLNQYPEISLGKIDSVAEETVFYFWISSIVALISYTLIDISQIEDCQTSSGDILSFGQKMQIVGILGATLMGPLIILHISRGDFSLVRQFFRTVLSFEPPITQAIKTEKFRNKGKKRISCSQRAIIRIASIFSGIRSVFRR